MIVESADRVLLRLPLIGRWYRNNTAALKRRACLWLDAAGLLRPISFVQWLATYGCNCRCPFCEVSAGKPAENELTTGEALGMVDDLASMGVHRLVISGGEPLVRPDLIHIMRHAHRRRMRFGLVTNSYRVEDLWDELKNFNYFLFYTSIDGLAPFHDDMRLPHSFERALKALERFKRLGVGTRIVNTVLQKRNLDQLDALLDILKSSAASDWRLAPLVKIGRARDKDDMCLGGQDLRSIKDFISLHSTPSLRIDFGESCSYLGCFGGSFDGRPFFCGAGLTRCDIMPDGEVLGCQEVYDNAYSEGNIRQKAFSRIWREEFKRFRSRWEAPAFCEGCRHFSACRGGCWSRMQLHKQCLKAVWERNR